MPRTLARYGLLLAVLDTQHRPGKPLMFGRPRSDVASGGRRRTCYRFSGPDPRVSMAPNLKYKDFDFSQPDSGNAAVSSHPIPHNSFSCDKPCVYNNLADTQFTNLRTLTLFTRPSIRKVDQMLEPP